MNGPTKSEEREQLHMEIAEAFVKWPRQEPAGKGLTIPRHYSDAEVYLALAKFFHRSVRTVQRAVEKYGQPISE